MADEEEKPPQVVIETKRRKTRGYLRKMAAKAKSKIVVQIVESSYNVSESELEGPGLALTRAIGSDELVFLERLESTRMAQLRFLVVTRRG